MGKVNILIGIFPSYFLVLMVDYFKTKFTIRCHISMIIKFILVPHMLVLRNPCVITKSEGTLLLLKKPMPLISEKVWLSKEKFGCRLPVNSRLIHQKLWEGKRTECVGHICPCQKPQRRCTQWSSLGCEFPWHRKTISGKEEVKRTERQWPSKILRLNNLNFLSRT